MFKRNKSTTPELDAQITKLCVQMSTMEPWAAEYTTMTNNLERLYTAKSKLDDRRVSPDAVLAVGGNLVGLGLIMNFERLHVISTKALGLLTKIK